MRIPVQDDRPGFPQNKDRISLIFFIIPGTFPVLRGLNKHIKILAFKSKIFLIFLNLPRCSDQNNFQMSACLPVGMTAMRAHISRRTRNN